MAWPCPPGRRMNHFLEFIVKLLKKKKKNSKVYEPYKINNPCGGWRIFNFDTSHARLFKMSLNYKICHEKTVLSCTVLIRQTWQFVEICWLVITLLLEKRALRLKKLRLYQKYFGRLSVQSELHGCICIRIESVAL